MVKQITKAYTDDAAQRINILSEGTVIKGDITSNSDLRIDGELHGNIEAKGKLVVGKTGKIHGEINANNIEISGFIKGKVLAKDLLSMKVSAKIEGDIIANKLSIEPGAVFIGTCNMGANATKETKGIK